MDQLLASLDKTAFQLISNNENVCAIRINKKKDILRNYFISFIVFTKGT